MAITCENCGACCLEVGSPPFLYFEINELPVDLQEEVLYWHNKPEREYSKLPCYWLDTTTKKCMHYEHRPQLCREFEIESISCIKLREIFIC